MKALISFFISLLFSFFIVFFTNVTSTLAFRELAVAHGVSITFLLVFLAIVTISFAFILLLYSLSRLVIDRLEYELSTTINNHSKYVKDSIVEYLVKHYTSIFNKVETIKVYNKNTISLISNSHDTLEHKLDKLLALSDSPANELPVDVLVLSKGEEVNVKAIHLAASYNSGVVFETDKGLLDMGLLVK